VAELPPSRIPASEFLEGYVTAVFAELDLPPAAMRPGSSTGSPVSTA
jgi:hypothetical protein